VETTLRTYGYSSLSRAEKGLLREYLRKMTGYSPAQLSRLIAQYRSTGRVRLPEYRRHRFPTKYTREDQALLAEVDNAHDLKEILVQYPFRILGFHADNGSEYINHVVAGLLEKLQIELTKSRTRQTNDQALVEGKNGSIVRKQIGVRVDRSRGGREDPGVLQARAERLPQLPPPVWVRDRGLGP